MAAVKYGQMLFMDALYLAVARQMDDGATDALARTARALAPYRSNPRGKAKTDNDT
jgi:DNA-binding MurR/RpiR family transcriptional regulator